jgi:hypothetical protein
MPMQTLSVGNSGVEVSSLCFGTDLIGSRIDRETSFRLFDMFREKGGTFIDTEISTLPGFQDVRAARVRRPSAPG